MPVSAHDVARELRRRIPDLGVVRLHKLLYYAQGWHLTRQREPLFSEELHAWTNGPVVADLWADEKYDRPRAPSRPLDDSMCATVDYVIERYGSLTSRELIQRTHEEDPWRAASESDETAQVKDPAISLDALRRWFSQDDEHVAYADAVARARERTDVYGFGPLEITPDIQARLDDVRRGTSIVETRPT